MTAPVDPTISGPAGLVFNFRALSRNAQADVRERERAARAALERWCIGCGCTASRGFGVTLSSEGVWSCPDEACIALAKAQAAEMAEAERAPIASPEPAPERPQPVMDLFAMAGEAA